MRTSNSGDLSKLPSRPHLAHFILPPPHPNNLNCIYSLLVASVQYLPHGNDERYSQHCYRYVVYNCKPTRCIIHCPNVRLDVFGNRSYVLRWTFLPLELLSPHVLKILFHYLFYRVGFHVRPLLFRHAIIPTATNPVTARATRPAATPTKTRINRMNSSAMNQRRSVIPTFSQLLIQLAIFRHR